MSELKSAMARVDAIGGAGESFAPKVRLIDANEMLQAAEAAHRAEIASAAETIFDGPNVELIDAIEAAEAEMKKAAAEENRLLGLDRSRAFEAVALTLADGGHSTTAWTPFAAQTAHNIAQMLTDVRRAPKSEDQPFRRSSSPADVAKGAKVAAAMTGAGQ